jgi:chromosome segregation protein
VKDLRRHEKSTEANREKMAQAVAAHNIAIEKETSILREQEGIREQMRKLRMDYDALRERLATAQSSLARLETEGEAALRRWEQTQSDIKSAGERLGEISARIYSNGQEHMQVAANVKTLQIDAEEFSVKIAELQEQANELDKPLKNAGTLYYSISQRLTELNNKISLKQAEITNNEGRRSRLAREEADFAAQRKSNLARVGELSASLSRTENLVSNLQAEHDEKTALLADRQDEAFIMQTEISELRSSLAISRKEAALVASEIEAKRTGGKDGQGFMEKFGGRLYREEFPGQDAYILYNDLFIFDDDKKYPVILAAEQATFSFSFIFREDLPNLSERVPLVKVAEGLYRDGALYKRTGKDNTGFVIMGLEKRQLELAEAVTETEAALKTRSYAAEELADELVLLKDENRTLASELKEAEIKLAALRTGLTHAGEESRRIDRGSSVVAKELAALEETEKSSANELANLENERNIFQEKRSEAEQERNRLESSRRGFLTELEKVRQEKNDNAARLARYTERESALVRETERLESEKKHTEDNIAALEKRMRELADKNSDEYKEQHEAMLKQKNELSAASLSLAGEIAGIERLQTEKEEALILGRKEIDSAAQNLRELDRLLASADSKAENVTEAMERLNAAMWSEHSEVMEDVYEELSVGRDLKKLNAEKASITEDIDGLGPLNMAAQAEYEEKHTHYETQTKQMADIEHSADNLGALIKEIDESTVQIFSDTFDAVRKNFTEVFTKFFGDGTADLILTEPADLLSTGVELKVNPPGKKISNNNLLSGGEKALAALTLLFSLFLQKPTPFCFLDEVDAPLDDDNAGRFIDMIRLLSADTQFVVITHKHKTMGSADSLYGVTMQEGGVSSILSVELA